MSQGTNQNQSNSSTQKGALYDLFLEELNVIDEAPSTIEQKLQSFEEKCQSWMTHIRTPSDSAEGSVKDVETSDSVAVHSFTEDEIREFVSKIYKPVKRKVHGFDYDKKTLKMLLLNEETQDSFKLLGVVGMLGVGKTTLCRLILDEEQVKQRYFPRLLITMPESKPEELASMKEVVGSMLEHLGVEEETIDSITKKHELPGLLYALHLQLQGKKFLIVLDDVKEEVAFQKENVKEEGTSQKEKNYYEDLMCCLRDGHGFPKGYGGVVILNGRNEKAIQKIVGERNVHRLELLSKSEDCWNIYQTVALNEDGEHDYPRQDTASGEVKEELKKKCGGLPLAARIMGELKFREMEMKHPEWNQKLQENEKVQN